jgi:hypothetical protein
LIPSFLFLMYSCHFLDIQYLSETCRMVKEMDLR